MKIEKMKELFNRHPIRNAIVLYGFYTLCFFLTEHLNTGKAFLIHSPLDDVIPFSRYAVLPYCLWFLEIAAVLLYVYFRSDRDEFFRAVFLPLILMSCSLPIFCLFPTEIHLRPAVVPGNDVFSLLTRFIYSVDDSRNVCPSVHVAVCYALTDICIRNMDRLPAVLMITLNVIISLSTLFLKQHSVIDVICGCVFAVLIRHLIDFKSKERI